MRSLLKNKRGAFTDLFLFMGLAFLVVIFMVMMTFASNVVFKELNENSDAIQRGLGDSGNATEIIQGSVGKVVEAYGSLKWISVVLIFGFALSILLTSFLVRTNPVFFVPYILIVVIAVIVSVPLSNTYEQVYQHPELAETFAGFFGATWIFLHLPIWVLVIGVLAGILMFINVVRNE
jgi:hypothetical protein